MSREAQDPSLEGYVPIRSRSPLFYDRFERKADRQDQTHYCPGCGHGVAHKLVAEALAEAGVQDRSIFVSPVGCSVFGYYYFDVGNVQAAHGRAPAVGTALKRSRPDSVVVVYQGDGDLAAIGTAEIIHAANRGEKLSVFFVNNAIYGMTGGQMAPTTLVGQKSTTTPWGRRPANEGYPLKMCELLSTLDAPVYVARVSLHDSKNVMKVRKAIQKAIQIQIAGGGFSFVEILSPCPTVWKMDPAASRKFIEERMLPVFPLKVFKDRKPEPLPDGAPAVRSVAEVLGLGNGGGGRVAQGAGSASARDLTAAAGGRPGEAAGSARVREGAGFAAALDEWEHPAAGVESAEGERERPEEAPRADAAPGRGLTLKIAGFGGQGILLLGQMLAEIGMRRGFEVSWLPSYGPEMRSGSAHCHVSILPDRVGSPLISRPGALIAMNEISIRKFGPSVAEGGLILYDRDRLPEGFEAPEARVICIPASEIADGLGSVKVANVVMLGALLEETGVLPEALAREVLDATITRPALLELDRRALAAGAEFVREKVKAPAL